MSETTPSPDPSASGDPTDPTAAPAPAPWTPRDPLAAPQPWAPPTPWSPDASGSGATPPGAPRPALPPLAPPTPVAHPWPGYAAPGWPPPGYPPPYAYPGAPPRPSSGGRIAAIVIAVTAFLMLVVCGCVGLAAIGSLTADPVASGDPYYDPGYGEPDQSDAGDGGLVTGEPVPSPATTPSGGPGRLQVVYEVTGTGPVDVEFYDANADFLQVYGVPSPWRLALSANDRERVQIIASPGDGTDAVTCRITIGGKVVSQDSGEYGATCFGW
ncbi:MmpS family transport accessory protein [Micromonospora sp. NPDC005806]|uniref:MmpS family transport accessory protein n=1 Tax=Micromonospora sp. NPDC005806 TaxID=3364234 RepID=UPI0036923BD0